MKKRIYDILILLVMLMGIAPCVSGQDITIPADLTATPLMKPELLQKDGGAPVAISALPAGTTKQIFPAAPCWPGDAYVGIQLYYDLTVNANTEIDWAADMSVSILDGTNVLFTTPLRVQTGDQTFVATAFYGTPLSCNANYKIRINARTLAGNVPQANVYLRVLIYKTLDTFDPAVPVSLNVNNAPEKHEVSWRVGDGAADPKGVVAYDLEWVFIDNDDNMTETDLGKIFKFSEPVRITTAALYYSQSVHYRDGRMWYRVRPVGYNPQFPDHRIPGAWTYFNTAIPVQNHEPLMNWSRVTTYIEEGEYKKVMNYLDGNDRNRQSMTNLSAQADTTLITETLYDFEGRKAAEMLATPVATTSLKYKTDLNTFETKDSRVAANTSADHKKFHYDNDAYTNSTVKKINGAGWYYSPDNTSIGGTYRSYLPDAEGYVYRQTQYLRDGTDRLRRQSNVGKAFRMDAVGTDDKTTRYYYGNPAPVELIRLFGTNVGNINHYKKNMTVDGNGQVNVSYLDQKGQVIATALAGNAPANVDPIASYTALKNEPITADLSPRNETRAQENVIAQQILNTVPNTVYNFSYKLDGGTATLDGIGCVDCAYDLTITITDPDGRLLNINNPTAIAGNESTDGFSYKRFNIKPIDCTGKANAIDIQFPVTFTDIGDYTMTKTLTPVDITFEQAKALVLRDPQVNSQIVALQNSYLYLEDPTNCDICTQLPACPETQGLIDDAIEEIATLDCENIRQQIIQDLRDLNAATPGYEPLEVEIRSHARYCEYELCQQDMNSSIYEKKLAAISTWSEAVAKGYTAAMIDVNVTSNVADPYFSAGGNGYNARTAMNNALMSVTPGAKYDNNGDGTPETLFVGKLGEITDPENTNFFINSAGKKAADGLPILYYDLKNRLTGAEYSEELDRQRWTMFRSFYLEAKRITRIGITTCIPAKTALQQPDTWPRDENGIAAWGKANGVTPVWPNGITGEVSDNELRALIANMQFHCKKTFSPTDINTITTNLRAYFNSKKSNFQRLILANDFYNGAPYLVAVDNVLKSYGCGLQYLVQYDNIYCVDEVEVKPLLFGDNLIVNPLLNTSGSGCGPVIAPCITGWNTANGSPVTSSQHDVYLKGICQSTTSDAVRGSFVQPLVPGTMYELRFSHKTGLVNYGRVRIQLSQQTAFTNTPPTGPLPLMSLPTCSWMMQPTYYDWVSVYESPQADYGMTSPYVWNFNELGNTEYENVSVYFKPEAASKYFFITITSDNSSAVGEYFKNFFSKSYNSGYEGFFAVLRRIPGNLCSQLECSYPAL